MDLKRKLKEDMSISKKIPTEVPGHEQWTEKQSTQYIHWWPKKKTKCSHPGFEDRNHVSCTSVSSVTSKIPGTSLTFKNQHLINIHKWLFIDWWGKEEKTQSSSPSIDGTIKIKQFECKIQIEKMLESNCALIEASTYGKPLPGWCW